MAQPLLEATIRPLKSEDWHDCYEFWHAPRVLRGTLQLASTSEDEVPEKVSHPSPAMHCFGAVAEAKVVGVTGLSLGRRRRSDVGYVGGSIHDDYPGRGVGMVLHDRFPCH